MSNSDEENDELMDLESIRDQITNTPRSDRMQVSAWEDDEEGVEEYRDANDPDQKAILEAAEKGDLEKVKQYYKANHSIITSADQDGYTPLHRACYGNHVGVVKFLLECGAKIDAQTQDEWQPLHSACYWNNVECAATLIAHGADINARTKGNQTPLHLVSATSHNAACLQLLLLHPETDPFVQNSGGDTAYDIAKRTGKYYRLFEIVEPCINNI